MNTEQFKQWCANYGLPVSPLPFAKPLIMGVLNVTPDSFSDGGCYHQLHAAVKHAHRMIAEGADLIDIGGESTKPGTPPVSSEEELARVIPLIKELCKESEICLSIDTRKPEVMRAAVDAGASVINDITAFQSKESLAVARELDVPLCLMHMQGEPQTMQLCPRYEEGVVEEINVFFQKRIEACEAIGIKRKNLILDPGFGFGKTPEHNMRLVNQLEQFHQHRLPLLLGFSRKSTLGVVLNAPVEKRLAGGLALAVYSAMKGAAIIRTHDVADTQQALTMVHAIYAAN